jgi:hypothetical protein
VNLVESKITEMLTENPLATASEDYVKHALEFDIIRENITPPYFLRIGINYHGQKVQHIRYDPARGMLQGWNPDGDALGTGGNAKMLLANHTIFERRDNEQLMSDSKFGGGDIPDGDFVRVEFKVRGWLGKTKNLDGTQIIKDIDLLASDRADMLVWCLSETAHRKWRGEGPEHQASRRTGINDFQPLLLPTDEIDEQGVQWDLTYQRRENVTREEQYEWPHPQEWTVRAKRITAATQSMMPRCDHFVTMCWRRV